MKGVEIITLIKTNLTRKGNGKDTPIRIITQYWTLEGDLVFEIDPCVKEDSQHE